jgi:hypothetical protein
MVEMNCQAGDLAIIVRGRQAGHMVNCIALAPSPVFIGGCEILDYGPVWIVDREVNWCLVKDGMGIPNTTEKAFVVPDRYLVPIRPPQEDETDSECLEQGLHI